MRYAVLLTLFILPSFLFAQTAAKPVVSVDVAEETVIVGQPVIVRIKVLVPTYMPNPPAFPTLEQEDLLVRLPERASGPVSEVLDGQTWSGVQRSYRLYPLSPGLLEFAPQTVTVTYADPETNDPLEASIPIPAISLTATIPDAARDLDPLIIATGFELTQEIEGATELTAGDAITRRLTASISGTSPILIPTLLPDATDPLLRAYPKEPRFSESEDRGVLSGKRVDETTFLVQAGGQTSLPEITARWFNLNTNSIEEITVPAVDLQLTGPTPEAFQPREMLNALPYIVLLGLLSFAAYKVIWPRFQSWRFERANAYRASPDYALAQLKKALSDHSLSDAYSALETWKSRMESSTDLEPFEAHLAKIGAAKYAAKPPEAEPDWPGAIAALEKLTTRPRRTLRDLPPLNP